MKDDLSGRTKAGLLVEGHQSGVAEQRDDRDGLQLVGDRRDEHAPDAEPTNVGRDHDILDVGPQHPVADAAGKPNETVAAPRADGGKRVEHPGYLVRCTLGPPPLRAVERNHLIGGYGTGRVRCHLDL